MMTHCSKPGCAHIASVVLSYDYGAQKVILEDATGGEISPHDYAMCLRCAEKLTPPRGWMVDDQRVAVPLFASERPEPHVPLGVEVVSELSELEEEYEPEWKQGAQLFFGSSQ